MAAPVKSPRPEFKPDFRPEFSAKSLNGLEKSAASGAPEKTKGTRYMEENPANKSSQLAKVGFTYTPGSATKKVTAKGFFKKNGPALGIGGGIIGTIIAAFFFSSSLLLPGITLNAQERNDASGSMLERRFIKMLDKKLNQSISDECRSSMSVKCRSGKLSRTFLQSLASQGIMAKGVDIGGTGYVDGKPASYDVSDGKGGVRNITPSELINEYKNNPTLRKQVKKAYNTRYIAWSSSVIKKVFFSKYNLKKNGGMASADSSINSNNAREELDKKTKTNAPDSDDAKKNLGKNRVLDFVNRSGKRITKAGGDPILTGGAIWCIASNIPRFVVGTYRAIQLVQLLGLVNDLVLSPGSMSVAGDIDSEKYSAIAGLLTERTVPEDGGIAKSALDSAILLSAIGVNTKAPPMSKYTPGYDLIGSNNVEFNQGNDEFCDKILSPEAAYAAAGITAAASATGVGGAILGALKAIGKILVSIGAIEAIIGLLNTMGVFDMLGDLVVGAIGAFAGNYIDGIHGEALGDAIGTGLKLYFSMGALSSTGSVLKRSQVGAFSNMMAEVANDYREEDIATLSPFDTSSPYTFLGSITYNLGMQLKTSGSVFSLIPSLFTMAISKTSPLVSATGITDEDCSYASYFGLDEELAINIAGVPCAGVPVEYLDSMGIDEVLDLVSDQIDSETGEVLEDSDLSLMLADCGSGDFESIGGCTIGGGTGNETVSYEVCEEADLDENYNCKEGTGETKTFQALGVDEKKRAAMSIRMLDAQLLEAFDGVEEPAQTTARPANTDSSGKGWTLKAGVNYSNVPCDPRTEDKGTKPGLNGSTIRICAIHDATKYPAYTSGNEYYVSSLISTNVINMFEAAYADGIKLSIFSAYREGWGTEHGKGLAMDLGAPVGRSFCYSGGTSLAAFNKCKESGNGNGEFHKGFTWMLNNAKTYGFYVLNEGNGGLNEAWHWSTSGK